jgi:hypothetical protein
VFVCCAKNVCGLQTFVGGNFTAAMFHLIQMGTLAVRCGSRVSLLRPSRRPGRVSHVCDTTRHAAPRTRRR